MIKVSVEDSGWPPTFEEFVKVHSAYKSKAQLMRELRQSRKEAGLVRFEDYIRPEHREQVKRYIERLRRARK